MVSHLLRHIRMSSCEPLHVCSQSHTSHTSNIVVLKTERYGKGLTQAYSFQCSITRTKDSQSIVSKQSKFPPFIILHVSYFLFPIDENIWGTRCGRPRHARFPIMQLYMKSRGFSRPLKCSSKHEL